MYNIPFQILHNNDFNHFYRTIFIYGMHVTNEFLLFVSFKEHLIPHICIGYNILSPTLISCQAPCFIKTSSYVLITTDMRNVPFTIATEDFV